MPKTDSLWRCKKRFLMQQQEILMSLRLTTETWSAWSEFLCDNFTVKKKKKDWWSRTRSLKPVEENPSVCLVKGALCTGSAAEKCVPPSSHFSRALGSWRRCQQSHRISCWQRLPSHALMQQQTKREEAAENNCTNHKSLKGWTAHLSRWRTARSLGLWRDSTLNAQVCPDVFLPPKRCYVTQNTICCVHSSICQKLNWWENCCNTVNPCHRFKQQTRRSIFPLFKKKKTTTFWHFLYHGISL